MNGDIFFSSFPVLYLFFICLALLYWLGPPMWRFNTSGESRYPCLAIDLGGNHLDFHHEVWIAAVDFLRIFYFLFTELFFICFIMEIEFCRMIFLHPLRWPWFFFFPSLLMWWIALVDFQKLNQTCFPLLSPTWSQCVFIHTLYILFKRLFKE